MGVSSLVAFVNSPIYRQVYLPNLVPNFFDITFLNFNFIH